MAVVWRERCCRGAVAVRSACIAEDGPLNMSGKQVNCDVGKWDQPLRMAKCFLGRRGLPNNFFDCNIISKFRQFQQLTFDMSKLDKFWGDELIWSKNIVNSGVCTSIRLHELMRVIKEFARLQKRSRLDNQATFPASFGYTVHEIDHPCQCNNDPSCNMH